MGTWSPSSAEARLVWVIPQVSLQWGWVQDLFGWQGGGGGGGGAERGEGQLVSKMTMPTL